MNSTTNTKKRKKVQKTTLADYPIPYERVQTCSADGEIIVDLPHAYKVHGQYYHNEACANEEALIQDALCLIKEL